MERLGVKPVTCRDSSHANGRPSALRYDSLLDPPPSFEGTLEPDTTMLAVRFFSFPHVAIAPDAQLERFIIKPTKIITTAKIITKAVLSP